MEDAFAIVLFAVVGIAAVVAVWALATSGSAYGEIGRGGIGAPEERPASYAEWEADMRQMLEAGNARRVARGEPPLDVDAEVNRRLRDLVEE
jgi:hypothetical protein